MAVMENGQKILGKFLNSIKEKLYAYKIQIKNIKGYRLKCILAFIHAFLLVFFTLLLQYITLTRSDEIGFLKQAAIIKHNILHIDEKPDEEKVAFVDMSKDIVTIDDPELSYDGNDTLNGARIVIKDRKKLAAFLSQLNRHPNSYKYIICDILFEDPSIDDSILQPVIESTPKILVTSIYRQDSLIKPIFKVRSGCVNYTLLNGSLFSKMPLLYSDSVKSLPLIMYEDMTGSKVTRKHNLTYFDGSIGFNTIIPELYYRPHDLRRSAMNGKPANLFYLGDLVTKAGFFDDYLKDKYIILGDFSSDNHATYLGPVPGCLLLFDSYLTLKHHPPVISTTWLLILLLVYFVASYFLFIHPEKKLKDFQSKVKFSFVKKMIIKYISYIGLMILIDLISYVFYSTFVSIFYLASYFTVLGIIIEKYQPVKKKLAMYMKKIGLMRAILFTTLLILSGRTSAQTYSVSAVRGNVYWQNRLLKNGDVLTDPKSLTSDNSSSKIRLLNPLTGSILISFVNCKPVISPNKNSHSELYELTIQKYVSNYDASRVLTTKGDFDWLLFFIDSCKGRMVIFENEKMPLTSTQVTLDKTVTFLAIIFSGKDSISKSIPVINDSLLFAKDIFPSGKPFKWKLEMSYQVNNSTKISAITDTAITSLIISNAELKALIKDFAQDWRDNYKNETEVKNDFYTYILVNYGVFYKGHIEALIDSALATR